MCQAGEGQRAGVRTTGSGAPGGTAGTCGGPVAPGWRNCRAGRQVPHAPAPGVLSVDAGGWCVRAGRGSAQLPGPPAAPVTDGVFAGTTAFRLAVVVELLRRSTSLASWESSTLTMM